MLLVRQIAAGNFEHSCTGYCKKLGLQLSTHLMHLNIQLMKLPLRLKFVEQLVNRIDTDA
jgi:hypothetical protein